MIKKKFSKKTLIIILSFAILINSDCISFIKIATGNFNNIQDRIDQLEIKAINNEDFTKEDKKFLKKLYSTISIGGFLRGYFEASKMLSRYIDKSGIELKVSAKPYLNNKKVLNEVERIEKNIIDDLKKKRLLDKYISNKIIIYPKDDPGLYYLSNVFKINAQIVNKGDDLLNIRYTIKLRAHFQSYADQKRLFKNPQHFRTLFNRNKKGEVLNIDDGLSHYLTLIDIAKEFDYYTEWYDEIKL